MGEIRVRGDTVTLGYWNQPDETRDAFCEGWLKTGDPAVIDSEGYVTIVDRKKDMIITGGEMVYSNPGRARPLRRPNRPGMRGVRRSGRALRRERPGRCRPASGGLNLPRRARLSLPDAPGGLQGATGDRTSTGIATDWQRETPEKLFARSIPAGNATPMTDRQRGPKTRGIYGQNGQPSRFHTLLLCP